METPRNDSRTAGYEGRVERGWRLTRVAWKLVLHDRTMLALALAGILSATLFSALIFYFGGYFSHPQHTGGRLALIALVALYPSAFVSVFFNVALASAASAAFDGDHMTVGEAVRNAYGKRGRIALWALISAFVGVVVSEIASRLPGGAKLLGWLVGAAWGLATIFVVPILAMQGTGTVESLKRSATLVKSRWGEGISGNVAIGAWALMVILPIGLMIGIGGAIAAKHPASGLLLAGGGVISIVAISALLAATRQVFAVALYRYAIDAPVGGFSAADLEYPFVADPARKKRKSWILRIGGTALGLFAILIAIVAIFHHPRQSADEGYFHIFYNASQEPSFTTGTPVEYHGRPIGSVVALTLEGEQVRVSFQVAPRYRDLVGARPAFVTGPPSAQRLCIGTRGECQNLPPPDEGIPTA